MLVNEEALAHWGLLLRKKKQKNGEHFVMRRFMTVLLTKWCSGEQTKKGEIYDMIYFLTAIG